MENRDDRIAEMRPDPHAARADYFASMRPRSSHRGNAGIGRIPCALRPSFNEAAILGSRKSVANAQHELLFLASMRPRSSDRGNERYRVTRHGAGKLQ